MSLPPPLPEKIARRHDLDALRSGAMLLGIALHAAMAYTTFPWVVQDANTHAAYDAFFWAVHGFRMPLFFLLSGFFTAMLWKKRGAWGLVKHRLLRIGLPLLVGCLTIVPVVFMLMGMAAEQGRDMAQADESRSKEIIWAAVATGDEEVVHEFLENGGSVHTLHPEVQCSLISVAAMHGRAEMVVYLIENDADVNQLNSDGSTALHGACLFGRAEVVRFLLSCGADHEIKSKHGQIPAQLLQTDWKTTQWVGDLLRIPLDREEVMAGRERCREVIGGEGVESPSAWAQVYNGLAYFPVFQHLWFLWFLCWLSVMFFLVVWLKKMFPKCERCVQWMASSWCYLWLVPLTAIIYYWQENGALMFGPDTSAGLLPMPSVLVYHAVFFGFGALLFWREKIPVPTRCHWVWQLVLSLCVLFPLGYGLINGRFPDLAAR
ncbi:MAG: acyltransferase family protein, partial [Akkermansiaceae bacterium]